MTAPCGAVLCGLTCGHRAHQHRAELDDGAEDVLGIRGARQVLTVTLQDEALVLFLEQNQDVLQQEGVQLWRGGGDQLASSVGFFGSNT